MTTSFTTENFTTFGYWWLPEKPDHQLPGMLKYEVGEPIKLEILGAFNEEWRHGKLAGNIETPILGIDSKGRMFTLFHCHHGTNLHFPGCPTTLITSQLAFDGVHFDNLEEAIFNNISVYFSYLYEWFEPPTKQLRYTFIDNKIHSISMNYIPMPKVAVDIENNIIIEIGVHANIPTATAREVSFCEAVFLVISRKEKCGFYDLIKIIYQMKSFFKLAMQNRISILKLSGQTEKAIFTSHSREKRYEEVNIYHYGIEDLSENIKIHDMLFCYKDIENRFSKMVGKWLELYEKIEPVLNIHSIIMEREPYIEHDFLDITQALETFHRRLRNNQELCDSQHQDRMEKILETVPTEYKDWLQKKLRYSNEPTLNKRLKELFKEFFCFFGNQKEFVRKVTLTRNNLIHPKSQQEQGCLSGNNLKIATEKLRLLLVLLLMKMIGFEETEIVELIRKNNNLMYWVRSS